MPRKTDANRPADWIAIAEADLAMVRLTAEREVSFAPCRSKLAEALEKVLKAELIAAVGKLLDTVQARLAPPR